MNVTSYDFCAGTTREGRRSPARREAGSHGLDDGLKVVVSSGARQNGRTVARVSVLVARGGQGDPECRGSTDSDHGGKMAAVMA